MFRFVRNVCTGVFWATEFFEHIGLNIFIKKQTLSNKRRYNGLKLLEVSFFRSEKSSNSSVNPIGLNPPKRFSQGFLFVIVCLIFTKIKLFFWFYVESCDYFVQDSASTSAFVAHSQLRSIRLVSRDDGD